MEDQGRYQSHKPRNALSRLRQAHNARHSRFAKKHGCAAVAQAQHDNPKRLANEVHLLAFDTKERPVE
jgi:hypothetical protein